MRASFSPLAQRSVLTELLRFLWQVVLLIRQLRSCRERHRGPLVIVTESPSGAAHLMRSMPLLAEFPLCQVPPHSNDSVYPSLSWQPKASPQGPHAPGRRGAVVQGTLPAFPSAVQCHRLSFSVTSASPVLRCSSNAEAVQSCPLTVAHQVDVGMLLAGSGKIGQPEKEFTCERCRLPWLQDWIQLARYGHLPVGNLGGDWLLDIADAHYARCLRDAGHLLWITDPGIPDVASEAMMTLRRTCCCPLIPPRWR